MKIIETVVRGINMKLVGYTRSLELCSRMNYETENLDFIDEMSQGEILYDLGACEGRFSVYASLKGISCYSFEPEENNFTALTENIAENGLPDSLITAYRLGVGASMQEAILNIGQPWAGGHQKVVEQPESREDLAFDFKQRQKINIVSLDEHIVREKLPYPNYLKIDIDGSEIPFIEGAQKTLSKVELKKIIFELEINDKNFSKIIENLSQNGLSEEARYPVPNEPSLFNIVFKRQA